MSATDTTLSNPKNFPEPATAAEKSGSKSLSFYFSLVMLYLLNVVDWLCTETLIASGKFYEANPIMQSVLSNFWLTVFVKGVLPLALVLLCALIYRLMDSEIGIVADLVLKIGIFAYAAINIWHILNFGLLFSTF